MNKSFLKFGFYFGIMMGISSVASAQVLCPLMPVCPVEANAEWMSEIKLLVESEISKAIQNGVKMKEMMLTDLMTGELGGNNVLSEIQTASKDGASAIQKTAVKLENVSDLSNYTEAQKALTENYMVDADKILNAANTELNKIEENQRVALNDLIEANIAYGTINTAEATAGASESEPDKRANDIGQAKNLKSLYEMMLGMDRKSYERSLKTSALDATDAGVHAMQILQGLSQYNRYGGIGEAQNEDK